MAKTVNNIEIENILVSVNDQLYDIPDNWCWIHLLDSFVNVTDSKRKLPTKEYLEDGDYPIVDQGQDFIGGYTNNVDMIYNGELPVIIFGDHTRCVKYIDFKFAQGADGVKVLKPNGYWDPKALYYAIQSVNIPNLGYRRHYSLFKNFAIPLPPLPEQKRIVEQIESLFLKLDDVKEKAQNAIDRIEEARATALQLAVKGNLTKGWRKTRGIEIDEWSVVSFGEIVNEIKLGLVRGKVEQSLDNEFGYIKMNNITSDGEIDLNDMVSVDASPEEVEAYSLQEGDFLFNTRNSFELVGKNAVWNYTNSKRILFNNNIMRVRFHDNIYPYYISYYFNSIQGKHALDKVKKNTTNIAAIYAKDLNKINIQLPSLEEQKEICSILNDVFAKQAEVKRISEQIIDAIDVIKKSILAKAFRGDLGTNDPSEESPMELLKQILQ